MIRLAHLLASVLLLALGTAWAAAEEPAQPFAVIVEGHGGVPLVVQEWGNPAGPAILLLHGFSFSSDSFRRQTGELAQEYRLIAPDLRGHGLSGKPWSADAYSDPAIWAADIAAILAAKEVERPVIVGWSFGGHVALKYLRECGASCARGLVLAGSLAGLVERPPPPDPAQADLPPPRGNARADEYASLLEGIGWTVEVMTAHPLSRPEAQRDRMAMAMTPPYARRAMAAMQLDFRDFASKLDVPVLFIYGAKDLSVPEASIAEAESVLPNATALRYEGSGHSPFAEEPQRFNADLAAFVERIADGEAP